jgi:hypothetical protein
MGHYEESGEVAIPIEKYDGKGASAAQKVGIADTYSKRYSLLAILAIAPVDDPDADSATDRKPSVDMPRRASEAPPEPATTQPAAKEPEPAAGRLISDPQRRRLWAIAHTSGENLDLGKKDVNDHVKAIIGQYGFDSTDDITFGKYDAIIREIEEWGEGA